VSTLARMRRALLLAVPLLSGCSLLKSLATPAQEPSLSFKAAQLESVDFEGANLNLVFQVTNPNAQGINLASAAYALEVEGHQIVSGQPPGGLQIPGNGSADLTFPAHLVFQQLAPALEALWSRDQVAYKASGSVGFNTPLGVVSMPLAHQGTFAPPHTPQAELGTPRLTQVTLTGARLIVPLKLTNRNPFPLPLGALLGSVEVDGTRVGKVALAEQPSIAGSATKLVELPLEVSFLSAGKAVLQAVQRGSAQLKLDGELRSGAASLPLHLEQNVQLQQEN